jgi:Lon protease-like protein
MALNIFEPRYRLLVRRCMEGNRRLGMAQQATSAGSSLDGVDSTACEAEITECRAAPDGWVDGWVGGA